MKVHFSEHCDLAVPWLSGCSAEAALRSRWKKHKKWFRSWKQFIIVLLIRISCLSSVLSQHIHLPGGVLGSQKPNREPFSRNEKRSHAQQCCMERQIHCCGDCLSSEQTISYESAGRCCNPRVGLMKFLCLNGYWVYITPPFWHQNWVNGIWSILAHVLPADTFVWGSGG